MQIFASADAYAVWTNTDLTEGRGREYIMAYCELESTANRLAKGAYVMGSNARITKETFLNMGTDYRSGVWYAPRALDLFVPITDKDREIENKLKEEREAKSRREKIIEKARTLGLSDDEINALRA